MRKILSLLTLVLLFSSCGDSEDFATVGATGTVPNQNGQTTSLPLLLQTAGGSVDATGERLFIRLDPTGNIQIGEQGEGGTISLGDFLAQNNFSEGNPRAAELEFISDGQNQFLPLFIESATQEGDGTLVLTAVGRPEIEDASVLAQGGAIGNISATVRDTNGEALPGATVSTSNRVAVTNERGVANIRNLPVGLYSVTAVLEGFNRQTLNNVPVKLGLTTPLTFTLTLQNIYQVDTATLRFLP